MLSVGQLDQRSLCLARLSMNYAVASVNRQSASLKVADGALEPVAGTISVDSKQHVSKHI